MVQLNHPELWHIAFHHNGTLDFPKGHVLPFNMTFNTSDATSRSHAESFNMTVQIEQPRMVVSNASSHIHTFSRPQNISFQLTNLNLTLPQDTIITHIENHTESLQDTLLKHIINRNDA